jgi:iron complex transport system ATP-binding protein
MSETWLIEAVGVGVELAGRRVVDGVTLRAGVGEAIAVVGPNGAGKTTLLRALAGLIPVNGGDLLLNGLEPARTALPALAATRTYCAQRPSSAWDYQVGELALISREPTTFFDWLVRFGLEAHADRRLSQLSGGEQKTAHLALALSQLAEPYGRVVLLDEPTDALDLQRQLAVREALRSLVRAGAACVVATHDLRLAGDCDRVIVLTEGRMIAEGPPAETLTSEIVREVWGVDLEPFRPRR